MTGFRQAALLIAAFALSSGVSYAADFDGSKRLLCATIEAHGCDVGETCLRVVPASVALPQFLRIDFAKQAIVGPKRTSPITSIERGSGQLLLQGTELGFGWTLALDSASGTMTATMVNRQSAVVMFGACTPD